MTDAPEDIPPDPPPKPKPAPKPKVAPALPSDNLGQRRAMSARMFRDTPKATSERLRAHAEKYGTDQVAECGAEAGMDEEQLTNLIASLDRINATFRLDPKRKHMYKSPEKTSPGYRARRLLGIEEPDLTKPSQDAPPAGGKVRRTRKKEVRGGGDRRRARKKAT